MIKKGTNYETSDKKAIRQSGAVNREAYRQETKKSGDHFPGRSAKLGGDMSRRDLISINGNANYGLNVYDTVGNGGVNNAGDVMTVQAMFGYLYELWARPQYAALKHLRVNFSLTPDGTMNQKTMKAILRFQLFNSWLVLGVDGLIHPAKYENRKIAIGKGKKLMTITALHLELWMAEPGLDYTQEIARRFPNIAAAIQ